MKLLFLLTTCALSSGCALASPPSSKFTVRVVDSETLAPVTNAVVQTGFQHYYDPWGNKPEEVDRRKEPVNEFGEVCFSGTTIQNGAGGRVFATGYYWGNNGITYSDKNVVLNRWEPWNPTIDVKLRSKKNPVSMVQKYIEWKPIPNIGSSVGFDLEIGDWVPPYGKGKISDLVLTTSCYMQDGKKGSEARYTLTFSNEHDGIQGYQFPDDIQSSFKWPYEAPTGGYQPILEKYKHWDVNGTPDKSNYDGKNNYIFRVRSQKLTDGTIVACYGMINGELEFIPQGKIKFSYLFNPIPNERSLEYNDVNLLKK